MERRERLSNALHGAGYVGQAFTRLCKAGCSAEWLELRLLNLAHFPFQREQAILPANLKRRLERIIRSLELAGNDLEELLSHPKLAMVFLQIEDKDWPVSWQTLSGFMLGAARCLHAAVAKTPRWPRRRWANPARIRIPYLIEKVSGFTGNPHYADMATLIGAAYERPTFSEADLKMFVSRTRRRRSR